MRLAGIVRLSMLLLLSAPCSGMGAQGAYTVIHELPNTMGHIEIFNANSGSRIGSRK
jgi:hypothetical protein